MLVEGIAEGGESGDVVVSDVGEGEGRDYGGARGADRAGGGEEGAEEAVPAAVDGGAVLGDEAVF